CRRSFPVAPGSCHTIHSFRRERIRRNTQAVHGVGSAGTPRSESFAGAEAGRFAVPWDCAFVNEVHLLRDISSIEKKHAIAGQSVASGTSGFLVVAFDVFGKIVVDDPTDIGFVDAHSEG